MKKIQIYDTTLRDGAQSEDITLSISDRIKIALRLDELGVDYIEGGWPGASPVDNAFFSDIQNYQLNNSKISAFGSTHHPDLKAEKDPNLNAIVNAKTAAASIFGKSCSLHAKEALRLTPERNLGIIADSVAFLSKHVPEVFFDAEHFFDGF